VLDVVVIGAGQAGLAAGYFLRQSGVRFVLLEREGRIGDAWRRRYDSLSLFSPRAFSALPGLMLDGDPAGYPTKDEIADYLERYAADWQLPVTTGEAVLRLEQRDDTFIAHSAARCIESRSVIVAAGAFQRPFVPAFARHLCSQVAQFTTDTYRNPAQVPRGRVLVVGGGATGRQIAWELASARDVSISMGRGTSVTPQTVLGKDTMWWADRVGLLHAHKDTWRGRLARRLNAFPGWHLRARSLRRRGVVLRDRATAADSNRITFADGTSSAFDSVVWAAGYRDDSHWLEVPGAVDRDGAVH
jgi:putative flavoprotein involved in K+ transport